MRQGAVVDTVREWLPQWAAERDRLDKIDAWYRGEQDRPRVPDTATQEMKRLADLSTKPWLGLVVTIVAQCMYVDSIRSALDPPTGEQADDLARAPGPWRTWLLNGMHKHQVPLHRAGLAYGQAFATSLPGVDWRGRPMSVFRGRSPRKMFAVYGQPATDDWAIHALDVETSGDKLLVGLLDEVATYWCEVDSPDGRPEYISYEVHDSGVCPVVRYTNMLDLDGRVDGEVAPLIPAAAQIDKTELDLNVVQHFGSWKVRTATGLQAPETEEEGNRKALELSISDILMAESTDARFGTLDATPLDGFLAARQSNIETLSAVSQSPTHELTGKMANLSAEALAAARASVVQKVAERKMSFGASHAQLSRLGASQMGDDAHADDEQLRVTWQDTEVRSLSQAADAFGKIAELLKVPPRVLWERIPGVEKTDVQEWARVAAEDDPITRYAAALERQGTPGADTGLA